MSVTSSHSRTITPNPGEATASDPSSLPAAGHRATPRPTTAGTSVGRVRTARHHIYYDVSETLLTHGEGVFVYDNDGNKLLDAASATFNLSLAPRSLAHHAGAVLVLSDSGGFSARVEHDVDAFVCPPGSASSAATAIAAALDLSVAAREAMRRASCTRVLRDSTWAGQALKTLGAAFPEVAAVADRVEKGLAETYSATIGG